MQSLIDYQYIHDFLEKFDLKNIAPSVISAFEDKCQKPHGDVATWLSHLSALPNLSEIEQFDFQITDDKIKLSGNITNPLHDYNYINQHLKALSPWRKGPFEFFDHFIDTEWNSALKWLRLKQLNIDFTNKNILDVGCGNGFFMWQMQQAQAKSIIGVDPSWLFYCQFMLLQKYIRSKKVCMLPIGVEALALKNCFDLVLSMGILYHQKSPLKHLENLNQLLTANGELILETMVLDSPEKIIIEPKERYAGMRNVSMITSCSVLLTWLEQTGFKIEKISELTKTSFNEQRQTDWMKFHSLEQFLDPNNSELTIEGYPAPQRIIISATK